MLINRLTDRNCVKEQQHCRLNIFSASLLKVKSALIRDFRIIRDRNNLDFITVLNGSYLQCVRVPQRPL